MWNRVRTAWIRQPTWLCQLQPINPCCRRTPHQSSASGRHRRGEGGQCSSARAWDFQLSEQNGFCRRCWTHPWFRACLVEGKRWRAWESFWTCPQEIKLYKNQRKFATSSKTWATIRLHDREQKGLKEIFDKKAKRQADFRIKSIRTREILRCRTRRPPDFGIQSKRTNGNSRPRTKWPVVSVIESKKRVKGPEEICDLKWSDQRILPSRAKRTSGFRDRGQKDMITQIKGKHT